VRLPCAKMPHSRKASNLMKRGENIPVLASVSEMKLAVCCLIRRYRVVRSGRWRSLVEQRARRLPLGLLVVSCTIDSRRGEPARSQCAVLASIAPRTSRRCVPSFGPTGGAWVRVRPAASGRRDQESRCRFRVDKGSRSRRTARQKTDIQDCWRTVQDSAVRQLGGLVHPGRMPSGRCWPCARDAPGIRYGTTRHRGSVADRAFG
jgi:hypothetical protein